MILPKMQGSRVSEKNISAFYGVNRTAKINDFQLSEMKNMDCETFPFAATRKSREKIYPLETEKGTPSPMKLICANDDIFDDYSVTGVTADGAFVYRGEVIESRKLDLSRSESIVLHGGYFVTFPDMNAFYVDNGAVETESVYDVHEDFETDTAGIGNIGGNEAKITVQNNSLIIPMDRRGYRDPSGLGGIKELLVSGALQAGTQVKLSMYRHRDGEAHWANIPETVYEVIAGVKAYDDVTDEDITPENGTFHDFFDVSGAKAKPVRVIVEFESYDEAGNEYDISQHFAEAMGVEGIDFRVGCWQLYENYSNLKIEFKISNMVFGVSYYGRLFGCDNRGVEVYYTSGGVDNLNFKQETSGSNAGVLMCSDPGKWTAMCAFNNALYCFKRDAMYRIYSSDGLTFYMERIADVGATGNEAVCVVDNVMYFLSSNGLYAFSGAYPQPLPDSLGRTYLRGVLGGDNRKLFCSLAWKENEVFKRELCVYHIDKGIFSVHDDFAAKQFVWFGGELYALEESGVVWRMDSVREAVEFCLDTKQYFFSFQKKAVSAARIYFEFDPAGDDGYFEILVSADNGEFVPATPKIANGRVRYVPIKFKKCDEFRIRICGEGVFTLKGISFALYQGGDVKQNR